MTYSSSRIIQIIAVSTVLVILVSAVHIYSNYSRFRQQAGLDVSLKHHEVALGSNDLEKLRPHFGHVLLEERERLKLKAAERTKKEDPWAVVQGEYKYPVEREIQQPSPFPVLRPLRGPPPSTKRKPQQDFVEEPHRLIKALPTFDRAGKLIYPNIEDEEPLNFDN